MNASPRAELLVNKPSISVFWSAYDPLDLASESIDPLGFMAGYIALADRILPGFTTVTTIPRYTGMLCLALRLAGESIGDVDKEGISVRRRHILEKMMTFERAWALACGLAEKDPAIGSRASEGVRGIRVVHRWRDLHVDKETVTLSFALLANQMRYGGIGAYSTFLKSLHLADMNALTLRPLGEQLADAFPSPTAFGLDVMRKDIKLSVQNLQDWGRVAHADTLSPYEAQILRSALQGAEEAEFDDHTRWTMLRILRACEADAQPDEKGVLTSCLSILTQKGRKETDLTGDAAVRIRTALRVIDPYERLYQCVLFMFDQIRIRANASGQAALQPMLEDESVAEACSQMRKAASDFLTEVGTASGEDTSLGTAWGALLKLGLIEFAQKLNGANVQIDIVREILQRHLRVQEGKFDGGLPKGPWVRLEPGPEFIARLTAQRFGIEASEARNRWDALSRHPYRTSDARRFVHLCRIQ
jgi:hypothetical protein